MKRLLLAAALLLGALPAQAQNVFFPANPGDMIVKGTVGAWAPVPGGTAGCVLMSNGPTAAPTWQCALPLNFGLPPLATNRVWGNVSGTQAAPSPIDVNQFLNTVGYDTLRTPPPGSMIYLEPTTATWQALVPTVNTGWVLSNQGIGKAPAWAFAPGTGVPGATGTCLVSNGPAVSPTYQSCLTGLGLTMTNGQLLVGQTGGLPLAKTVSGDGTLDLNAAFTLAAVNANAGSWGSGSAVPIISVNAKGLITAVSTVAVAAANWTPSGTGGAARTVVSSLQERGVTPTDYGAVPNDNTKGTVNAAAFANAFAASGYVYCNSTDVYYTQQIVIPTSARASSHCAVTAVGSVSSTLVSIVGNANSFILDDWRVTVDPATYPTVNGVTITDAIGTTVQNSTITGQFGVYVTGNSVDVTIDNNSFNGFYGRAVWATASGGAAVTFTVTSASPGVFTHTAHGLSIGNTIILYTTGALYTPLNQGQLYYVQSVPTADTFTLSETSGGAAINTSGAQSGTHYYTSNGPRGVHITNNNLYKYLASAHLASTGFITTGVFAPIISHNHVYGTRQWGAACTLGSGCLIANNFVASAEAECVTTSSSVNAIISNNNCLFDSTSGDTGISVSNSDGPVAWNTAVVGNILTNVHAGSILAGTGMKQASIYGNTIINPNQGSTTIDAGVAIDGSGTTGNFVGQNSFGGDLSKVTYQVKEANFTGGGTPSGNYISQQLGASGTTGFVNPSATTQRAIVGQSSLSSVSIYNGFRFESGPFALRDVGASSVELFDFDANLVGSLNGAGTPLLNWGNTTHRWSSRGFGSVYASLSNTGWNWANIAAPGTPAAGTVNVYTDSTSKRLCGKDDAGLVACATPQASTSYTPTITAGSGTFTTVSGTGSYKQDGKWVTFRAEAIITTNGTAAGKVLITLPVAVAAGTINQSLQATNTSIPNALAALIAPASSTTQAQLFTAAGAYPGANATVLDVQGVYEVP